MGRRRRPTKKELEEFELDLQSQERKLSVETLKKLKRIPVLGAKKEKKAV